MTINTPLSQIVANGNGIATVFSFSPVTIFAASDLTVTFVSTAGVETVLTEGSGTSNYSVALLTPTVLPSTGSITYPATLGTQLANGEQLIIKRVVDLLQETDLNNQGGYFSATQEAAFDYAMMVDIQQQDEIDRSMKLQISDADNSISVVLPHPVAGQGLVWNGSANALISAALTLTADISSSLIVVSAVQPGLVDGRIWIDTSIGGARVVRICDGADYNEVTRFATAGGDLTIVKPITFTSSASGPTIAVTGTGLVLNKTTIDNGATGVVDLNLHSSGSPAINDIIYKAQFVGRDSALNNETYAEDQVVLQGVTSGVNESAIRRFRVMQGAGTLADRLNIGAGIYTPAVTDKGTDSINASALYIANTLVAASDTSIQSGAAHSPVLADHGKTFIYTNAAGCTVTMPAAAGLFPGWQIYVRNQSTGAVIINRSSTDTIESKGVGLTTMRLPRASDAGSLIHAGAPLTGSFFWTGRRSFDSGDQVISAAGLLTIAHTLGVLPDRVDCFLHNTTNELGYTGQTIQYWAGTADQVAAGNRGQAVVPDTANISVRFGSAAIPLAVQNFTTGASAAITLANWRIVYRAVVVN